MTYKLTIEDCRVGDEIQHNGLCYGEILHVDKLAGKVVIMATPNGYVDWYYLGSFRNLSAERRHAEAKTARPKWVKILHATVWDGNLIDVGEVYKVLSWRNNRPSIHIDSVGPIELFNNQWEPAPAPVAEPVEQEPPSLELDVIVNPHGYASVATISGHRSHAGQRLTMIERRAYDKAMARISELERELAEKRRENASVNANTVMRFNEPPAAPKVEPFVGQAPLSEYAAFTPWQLMILRGVETISAQLAELAKGGK